MSELILKYPLDLRGNSAQNLVLGEVHTIPDTGNRVLVTHYGPFFTEGLVVRDHATGEELVRNEQWKAAQLYQEAAIRTGLEVCSVIVITDDTVSNAISLDYQVVGGAFSLAAPAVEQAIADLDIDERAVQWGDLLAAPDTFPPVSHMHDAGDLYGFEYVVASIEQLRHAILIGDEASHDEIRRYSDDGDAVLMEIFETIKPLLDEHIGDRSNPHAVTKSQVGLSNVQNFAVSTKAQAEGGISSSSYMTPLRVREAIEKFAEVTVYPHFNDTNNPHNVTPSQLGVYTENQVDALLNLKLNKTGTAVNSTEFNGRTYSEAYANIRANLDASLVTTGRFPTTRLGSGTRSSATVLFGDGVFRDLSSKIAASSAEYWAGRTTLAAVKSAYAGYPNGIVVGFYHYDLGAVGTGNGVRWRYADNYQRYRKNSSTSWSRVG